MKEMADIHDYHGHPLVGVTVTALLYILARVTASDLALYLTMASATVVIIANTPKSIKSFKELFKKKNQ